MNKSMKKYFIIFVGPTLIAFFIAFIIPFVMGLYLSFCDFTTVTNATFVGISNYITAFTNDGFLNALWFTVKFAVVAVITINVCGFTLALLLTQKIRGTNIFRTIFFMPNLIGGIVLGYIWQSMINGVLSKIGVTMLMDPSYGYWGLIILMNWQLIGYIMVIYIAGLQNVSPDLIEAAKIDGAGPFRIYWSVVLPNIRPAIGSIGIFTAMMQWNDYLNPLLMLNDMEKMTMPLGLVIFNSQRTSDLSATMAAATMIMMPMIIIFVMFQKQFIKGMTMSGIK